MPKIMLSFLLVGGMTSATIAHAQMSPAPAPCDATLAPNEARVGSLEALNIPLQLGFVSPGTFERTVLETRHLFVTHLGAPAAGRDWTLTLTAVHPLTAFSSIAYFSATDRRTMIAAPHAAEPEQTFVRVVFDLATGAVQRSEIGGAAIGAGATNVRLVKSVENEIDRQAKELIERVHPRYANKSNAERAANHRRLKIGRTFSAANRSTIWIEAQLRVLFETSAGGLNSHVINLVFAISPTQHVHLRATDHPAVMPFLTK